MTIKKIDSVCPKCGCHYGGLKPEFAGKKVKCKCGKVFRLASVTVSHHDAAMTGSVGKTHDDLQSDQPEQVETADRLSFSFEYDDLDQVLASQPADDVLSPGVGNRGNRRERRGVESRGGVGSGVGRRGSDPGSDLAAVGQPSVIEPHKSTLPLVVGFLTASAAICFFGFLICANLMEFASPVYQPLANAFQLLKSTELDLPATQLIDLQFAPLQKTLLFISWAAFLLLAATGFGLGIMQYAVSFVQLFRRQIKSGWIDGWLATVCVITLFLALTVWAVHDFHLQKQLRQLTFLANDANYQGFLSQLSGLSHKLADQRSDFSIACLMICIPPVGIFIGCMLKLNTK